MHYVSSVRSVRIAIVDLRELTRVGLAQLLAADEVRPYLVVPADSSPPPDAVLYGVDSAEDGHHDPELHALLRRTATTVIATYLEDSAPGAESALACGAHGALSLKLPAAELLSCASRFARPWRRANQRPKFSRRRAPATRGSRSPD